MFYERVSDFFDNEVDFEENMPEHERALLIGLIDEVIDECFE